MPARSTAAASAWTCTPTSSSWPASPITASWPSPPGGETPYFTDAERAALALTEAGTRLADRPDAVPDDVWEEAARHYGEPQLAGLAIAIAAINAFNRINATTRQISGDWTRRFVEQAMEKERAA